MGRVIRTGGENWLSCTIELFLRKKTPTPPYSNIYTNKTSIKFALATTMPTTGTLIAPCKLNATSRLKTRRRTF